MQGNIYKHTLQPLFVVQGKAMRIITSHSFLEYSCPLFKKINAIIIWVCFSQCCFHVRISKSSYFYKFWVFFSSVEYTHNYNTWLSQSRMTYAFPQNKLESLTFDIKLQRSAMILVTIRSFWHLNILRKRSNQTLLQAVSTFWISVTLHVTSKQYHPTIFH